MVLDKENKEIIEKIFLLLFVCLIIYLRIVQPFDARIFHEYPQFYSANDAFQDISLADYTKASGTPLYSPPYMSTGFSETNNITPPLIFIFAAMLSKVSGMEVYDAIYLITVLASIISMLVMYLLIRRHSINLALVSLPFMLGVFNFSFELIFPFGIWNLIVGTAFIAGSLWAFDNILLKHSSILLGILLAASALAHTVQTIFATGLIAGYLVLKFALDKKIDRIVASNVIKAYALMFVISAYYLNIMKLYFGYKKMELFTVSNDFNMAPGKGVSIWHFDYTVALMIIGISLFAISAMHRNKNDGSLFGFLELKESFPLVIFTSLYFLLIGYTNYIGFSERAWQIRTLWPIYLSPLFGLGALFVLKKIKRNITVYQISLVSLLLLAVFFNTHEGKLTPQGVMDKGTWDGIEWIRGNTLENDRVFYFYTPLLFTRQAIPLTERMTYSVNFDDFVDGIKNQSLKPEYKYAHDSEYNGGIHRTGLFSFAERTPQERLPFEQPGYFNMNYYIFTISALGDHPALIQYNLAIRENFLSKNMAEVYNNGRISILKNTG